MLEVGILAFCLRCEDVLQLPFGKFLYGDLSPISGGTRFGKAFIAMTLGFALVAAFVYLAWLLERAVLLVPALVLSLALRLRALALGPRRRRPGLVVEDRARRLGAPLGRVALDRRARLARRRRLAGRARRSGARRSCASRGSRRCSSALVLAAGTYLAIVRLPAPARSLDAALRRRCCSSRSALVAVALALGRRAPLLRPAAARAAPATASSAASAAASLGESAVAIAVLLVAAMLVDSKPPPRPVASAPVTQAVAHR